MGIKILLIAVIVFLVLMLASLIWLSFMVHLPSKLITRLRLKKLKKMIINYHGEDKETSEIRQKIRKIQIPFDGYCENEKNQSEEKCSKCPDKKICRDYFLIYGLKKDCNIGYLSEIRLKIRSIQRTLREE